jgi:hypothetical protein
LLENGFDSLRALRSATMDDLLKLGLKLGHARLLLSVLTGQSQDTASSQKACVHTSQEDFKEFLAVAKSILQDCKLVSRHMRQQLREKKAELGLDDDSFWRALQASGWSRNEFEDGERS